MSAELIAKALALRERWVDLGDGRRVLIRRPGETPLAQRRRSEVTVEWLAGFVIGWEGVTEADVIGTGTAAVPFDADLWRVVVEDRVEWAAKVAEAVLDLVNKHTEARAAALGN